MIGHARRPTRRAARVLLVIVAATLLVGVSIDALAGVWLEFGWRDAVEVIRGSGAAAPLVLIGLMFVAVVIPPVPSVPLDIAAGAVFGVAFGVVWVLVGAELGAIAAFLIARRLGRDRLVRRLDPDTLARVDSFVERRGATAIFAMRLLPTFHFDLVSYAAGLTSLRLAPFAIATLAGMTPPVIAIVTVGAQLDRNPAVAATIFGALAALVIVPLAWWSIVPERGALGQL